MQHVTAACHHCLEPACMIACPVNAYEKDPVTGIVKHLDDQCFGCQYCTMACPYDVPKYHPGKGIVRKCDMCSSRLAVGEPPACVQACPHEAIAIRVVNQQQVVEDAEAAVFLPARPDPQITLPTTTYKTRQAVPAQSAAGRLLSRQSAARPLAAGGDAGADAAFGRRVCRRTDLEYWFSGSIAGLVARRCTLLRLSDSACWHSRPACSTWAGRCYAFRAVLGLRHSWLSREIVAFGAFAALASLYAGALFVAQVSARNECCRRR